MGVGFGVERAEEWKPETGCNVTDIVCLFILL